MISILCAWCGNWVRKEMPVGMISHGICKRCSDNLLDSMEKQMDEENTTGDKPGEYSVCQFFLDKSYEYVRRFVDAETAVKAFKHYTTSVGARLGTTVRVILTDGGNCINMEWQFGKGIVFPTAADIAEMEKSDGR